MSKAVILCVDDEPVVLDSLKIQLKNAFQDGFAYEAAETTVEALELIEALDQAETPVLVIVSDWLMPGIKGDEFLIQIHRRFPQMVKILLTGQATPEAIERAKCQANLHRYLPKPWNRAELIEAIQSGLAQFSVPSTDP